MIQSLFIFMSHPLPCSHSLTHSPTHCSSYFDTLWTLEMPASITIYGLETCFFSLPDSSPQIILRLIPLWFLSLNSSGITGTSRDLHLSTTLVCFFFHCIDWYLEWPFHLACVLAYNPPSLPHTCLVLCYCFGTEHGVCIWQSSWISIKWLKESPYLGSLESFWTIRWQCPHFFFLSLVAFRDICY